MLEFAIKISLVIIKIIFRLLWNTLLWNLEPIPGNVDTSGMRIHCRGILNKESRIQECLGFPCVTYRAYFYCKNL